MTSRQAIKKSSVQTFGPKSEPQRMFVTSPADIVLYGGSAGSGKSFMALIDVLRYIDDPYYRCVFFRKTSKLITNPGALWDEASDIYPKFKGVPNKSALKWTFPSGAEIYFSYLEQEKQKYDWKGAQLSAVYFDETTEFTETMCSYLASRLRSKAKVNSYMKWLTNPDANSWLRKYVDWYLQEDGRPDRSKSGIIRWFVRRGDDVEWANSKQELIDRFGEGTEPKSFTFISATCLDNPVNLENNPGYLSELKSLPRVERERQLHGNWHVTEESSGYFKKEWVTETGNLVTPLECQNVRKLATVRAWDLASELPSEVYPNPDYTACVKMSLGVDGYYYIEEAYKFRQRPHEVQKQMKEEAQRDGSSCTVVFPQEVGAGGKYASESHSKNLAGFHFKQAKTSGSKISRFLPFSAAAEAGLVRVVKKEYYKDPWTGATYGWSDFLTDLEVDIGSRKVKDD
jgi:phage terminase large subunit-like protein